MEEQMKFACADCGEMQETMDACPDCGSIRTVLISVLEDLLGPTWQLQIFEAAEEDEVDSDHFSPADMARLGEDPTP